MTQPMPDSLDAALLAFQADMPALVKDKSGQVGNQKTKYADLVQANEQVLTRLNKLGVIYTCEPTLLDSGQFVMRYSLTHVPTGEHKTGNYPLKLSENPQHMGSAITYARRYVLLAVTGVAAEDEDDDGDRASGRRMAQRAPQASRAPTGERPNAQRAARPARSDSAPALPGEPDKATQKQMGMMHALFGEIEMTSREDRLRYVSEVLGREVGSSGDITKREAGQVIDKLQAWANETTSAPQREDEG